MVFKVTIIERLQKVVDIEADSFREACELAEDNWKNAEYILDADDFAGVEFVVEEADK